LTTFKPTGTATFKLEAVGSIPGFSTITSQPITLDGNGQASFDPVNDPVVGLHSSLPVGVYTLTVTYSGDTFFSPSVTNPPLSQTVNKASTVIQSSVNPTAPVFGQTLTVTAVVQPVSPGAGVPSGTVDFTITIGGVTKTETVVVGNGGTPGQA